MAHEATKPQREQTPEEWQHLREILANVLELPAAERSSYLDRACGSDSTLRSRVLELIAAHNATGAVRLDIPAFSITSPSSGREKEQAHASFIGRRIGAYRIESEIAHGGMGTVFHAVRADDEFNKQVAIKLMGVAGFSVHAAELFRRERQVLANLEHPNIARLLDGGTSEDGNPYLVMEYVEGELVTEYCQSHKLSIHDRLKPFQKICSAVHYAHQNLVIHRDIKPGNVLVTREGEPKLLDFGIAKIIDLDASANATATAWQALTPAYASPEQISGEPITTATDVYSLGLVLYELLTGQPAFSAAGASRLQLQRAILEEDPELPSKAVLRRHDSNCDEVSDQLKGDLDSIVLKAIRKGRAERYSSVEQLSEDIRRHLEKLPVLAHRDTVRYRLLKFGRRHKTGVVAAALILLSLLTGIFLTAHEARVARAQQVRAERNFNDVRKLSNSLIFEIHDSIQTLPGATPARKLLLERASQYLDRLAAESSGDISLQRDLGAAYERVGQLQGNAMDANTGETGASIISLQKAITIDDRVAKANLGNVDDQLNAAHAHSTLSSLLANSGGKGSREELEKAIAITNRLLSTSPSNPKVLIEQGVEYDRLAFFQDDAGDAPGAAESLKKGLALEEAVLKSAPDDRKQANRVAIGRARLSNELAALGLRREALDLNRAGLDLYERLTQDETNAKAKREMAVVLIFRGNIFMQDGDIKDAVEVFSRSRDILESLQRIDPKNVLYRLDVAGASASLGRALASGDQSASGIALLDRSIATFQESIARDQSYTDIPYQLAVTQAWKGEALARTGDVRAALGSYQNAATGLASLLNRADSDTRRCDLAAIHDRIGTLLSKSGQFQEASAEYQIALNLAEPFSSKKPPNVLALYAVADAYFGNGESSRRAAENSKSSSKEQKHHWSEAREWYRKSADAWRQIPNPARETSTGIPVNDPKNVILHLEQAEFQLTRIA